MLTWLLVICFSAPDGRSATMLFDDLKAWLPSDIETIYVSNGPIGKLFRTEMTGLRTDFARLAALAIVQIPEQDIARQVFAGFEAEAGVYVGRRFRFYETHGDLGLRGRLDGCSFLRSSTTSVASIMASSRLGGSEMILGTHVRWARTPKMDGHAVLLAAIQPTTLMVCNDRGLASEVLQGRRRIQPTGNFVVTDSESARAHFGAPVWGLRRFRKTNTDPTSPLTRHSALAPYYHDALAEAMIFSLDSDSAAKVTYITRNSSDGYRKTWDIPGAIFTKERGAFVVDVNPSLDPADGLKGRILSMLLGVLAVV